MSNDEEEDEVEELFEECPRWEFKCESISCLLDGIINIDGGGGGGGGGGLKTEL